VMWFGWLAVARSTLSVTTERSSNALAGRFAARCVVPSSKLPRFVHFH
jgi:hypothetical protein